MDGQGCMVGIRADVGVVMRLKSEWVYGGRYRLCTCRSWKNPTVHYVATWHCLTIPHWSSNSSKFCPTHQTVNISMHIFFNIEFGSIDLPNMYKDQLHTHLFWGCLRFSFIDILPLFLRRYKSYEFMKRLIYYPRNWGFIQCSNTQFSLFPMKIDACHFTQNGNYQ